MTFLTEDYGRFLLQGYQNIISSLPDPLTLPQYSVVLALSRRVFLVLTLFFFANCDRLLLLVATFTGWCLSNYR